MQLWLTWLKKFYTQVKFIIQYYSKKFSWKFGKRLPSIKALHLNAFPAMHFKKFDWVDFTLRFSGEIIVVILALTIGICNLNFFYFQKNNYSDESHAAKFLAYHPDLNQNLYKRNTSIITTISKEAGFISRANAQNMETLSNEYTFLDEQDNYNYINEEFLTNPAPDSVKNLLEKQIKIYETQVNDTLSSVAKKFEINEQTIIWANKLPNKQIKPGWFLVILPKDGVLVKADSNTTLPDLAKKYNADLDTIISYNGLANAEDIDGGQLVLVPGGTIPEPPKPKTVVKKDPSKVKPQGVQKPKIINNGTGHIFPWGYCTWYVATQVHVPWGGNAKNWLANARAYGALITNSATVGAIVVTTDNRKYGHVALVTDVNEKGFNVSEMNYKQFGKTNTRFIPHNSKIIRGFILP